MSALTERQQQVLDFIRGHRAQTGISPSLREIQRWFGLASPFGIQRHVDALVEKGLLKRGPGARWLIPTETTPREKMHRLLDAALDQKKENFMTVFMENVAKHFD